jgi:hypothetical protein
MVLDAPQAKAQEVAQPPQVYRRGRGRFGLGQMLLRDHVGPASK